MHRIVARQISLNFPQCQELFRKNGYLSILSATDICPLSLVIGSIPTMEVVDHNGGTSSTRVARESRTSALGCEE